MDKTNTTTEILTIGEARRRLPNVRVVVEKIMRVVREANVLHAAALGSAPESERREKLSKIEALHEEFKHSVAELNTLGAVLKDAERGLIDFFGWVGNEVVHLCWLYGEETIGFWHGVKDGFAGRRPIEDEEVA